MKLKRFLTVKAILFTCLLSILGGKAFAQDQPKNWTIEVKGQVTENDKRLPGAVITLYDGGTVVNTINSSDGRFDLQLQQDKDYTMTFTKPGYVTKKIDFSTKNVPPDRSKYGFTTFNIEEVDIFPEMEGTDVDQILQQPVAKIGYDAQFHNGDFTYDQQYTSSIQAQLDKIIEARRLLEANYKKAITKGDAEFQKKQWEDAKADYTAALKLKPNEQYPKDQLAAIEKAIAAQKIEDEKNAQKMAAQKALQAKYDSVIRLADAGFNSKEYEKAKSLYNQALGIIPGKKYPTDQINNINKIRADQKKAQQPVAVKPKPAPVRTDTVKKKVVQTPVTKPKPPVRKPVVKKDSVVTAPVKKDTAKPRPAIHVNVAACNIPGMSDTCRRCLKPFLYNGVNALHIALRTDPQEREINIPAFAGQRYRIIINISAMPAGTNVSVYEEDNSHKKRKELYSIGDAVRRTGYVDAVSRSGRFFVDYDIPAGAGSGCAVMMVGYETNK